VKEFQYIAPENLADALSLTAHYGSTAALLAGGTDLVVQMKHGARAPSCIINLKRLSDLNHISYSKTEGLHIGPLVTHNTLVDHPIIIEKFVLLAEAARSVGTFQVRERGTIGGNICNGSPAADIVPSLICLGAKLKLQSITEGDKSVPIEDFFKGPQETRRLPEEIMTEIQIPTMPNNTSGVYLKLGVRKALEIAIVGVAAVITLDDTKTTCLGARIGLASVAPTPIRCRKAETVLLGQKVEADTIKEAARIAQEETTPISDLRSTAEYRRGMVFVLTARALNEALHRAKGLATTK